MIARLAHSNCKKRYMTLVGPVFSLFWRTMWTIVAEVNSAAMFPKHAEDMIVLFYSWKLKPFSLESRKVHGTLFYYFLLGLADASSTLDHISRPERNKDTEACLVFLQDAACQETNDSWNVCFPLCRLWNTTHPLTAGGKGCGYFTVTSPLNLSTPRNLKLTFLITGLRVPKILKYIN